MFVIGNMRKVRMRQSVGTYNMAVRAQTAQIIPIHHSGLATGVKLCFQRSLDVSNGFLLLIRNQRCTMIKSCQQRCLTTRGILESPRHSIEFVTPFAFVCCQEGVAKAAVPRSFRSADQIYSLVESSADAKVVKNWRSKLIIVRKPIVESDSDCPAWQAGFALQEKKNVVQSDRHEILSDDFHLTPEYR